MADLQVLFIEDSDGDVELVSRALEQGGIRSVLKKVESEAQLIVALRSQKWDLILSDDHVPGFATERILKSVAEEAADLPLIFVSGAVGEEKVVQLLKSGARDFISKSNLARLASAVNRELSESDRARRLQQVERRLSESEENFRAMIESVKEYAIFMLDEKGSIATWNAGAERILGYTEKEALGQSVELLYTDEDRKRRVYLQDLEKVRISGQLEDERWYRRKNGSRFWVNGATTALVNEQGVVRGFTKIMRDTTDKKLAVEQLEDARRKAESANRAKTQFLANMSHEIRTPLGIMLGFAELITDPKHTPTEKENFVQAILRNGQLLSRIINDVLDVSKVEANKLETEKVEFMLSDFLADILAMMQSQAEEKGLELVVSTEGPVPRQILTDPTRLRQILSNLIGNSIKFTEMGMIELKVRSVSSPQTHSSMILEFEVKDTGRGVSRDNVPKLFQPFTQGDDSNAREFGGTGLGLYLSKRLAQALGGDLILRDTSENRGSTFVFTVDAGPFETDVRFYTERSSTSTAQIEKSLQGLRILVVDDSPDNRLLVKRILEHSDAKVEVAENGLAGVEAAQASEFDLILMDIQMPIMDGYEAFKQLRMNGFQKPIVALTAHALHSEREYCFSLGFSEHLSKPIDRKLLVETIARLCLRESPQPHQHHLARGQLVSLKLQH